MNYHMHKMADADGYINLGVKLYNLGNLQEAISAFIQALEIDPDDADTYHKLGRALAAQDNMDIAIKCYRQALQIKPNASEIHFQLANALKHQDKNEEAIASYLKVIQIEPTHLQAYNNMAVAEHALGNFDDAIRHYQKALEIDSKWAEVYNNIGKAFKDMGLPENAEDCYRKAIELKPDFTEAYIELGNVFYAQCKIEDAVSNYDKALTICPEHSVAHWDRSVALLLNGNFEEGWQEFEWRSKLAQNGTNDTAIPEKIYWDGSRFDGKRLFIFSEQGLGDTLQFVRYLPKVKALGGTVILGTYKPLVPLLSGFNGVDKLVEISQHHFQAFEYDLFCPILSLPGIFKTTLKTIPRDVPYLDAPPQKVSNWRRQLDNDAFKVGIVWKGSPIHANDRNRSCDLEPFLPLVSVPGVRLYSLQKGPAIDDLKRIFPESQVKNIGPHLKDFSDTAGLLANLDLVISVDTAVVHLAGAMGLPVWTLLPFAPDWRWQLNRKDTPWYPSMQLFRQVQRGNWQTVFQQIMEKLHVQVNAQS